MVRSRLTDGYQAWYQHDGELTPEWHPTAERAVLGSAAVPPARLSAPVEERRPPHAEGAPWAA
jgi:hypothetical protein